MRSERLAGLTILLVALSIGAAIANPPQNMNVQGRLTDGSGNPVAAGPKDLTFKIFDAAVGGSEIWPGGLGETQNISTDANGLWNANIGAQIPLTDNVFADSSRWLEVTVDDGANPIETLPRIKLNRAPYSSAYVNETGDIMTGPLRNFWTQENSGANIDVQNNNDGYTGYWDDGLGTWGMQSEAQSDDVVWNIGVAGAARGNNSSVANYGLYGAARGTGAENIAVYGETGMNGTTNYSGYFINGDFLVAQPFTAGTNSVQLPLNAIDNTEILDEPGVTASATAVGSFAVGTSYVILNSTSAGFPGPGYVVVIAEATFRANTASTYLWYRIRENGVSVLESDAWDAGDVDGFYDQHQSIVYTGAVPAGAFTYDLSVRQNSGTVDVVTPKVTVLYFPTTYGVVAPAAANGSDDEFMSINERGTVPLPRASAVNIDAERTTSIAANQARVDQEVAALRAKVDELAARLESAGLSPTRTETTNPTPHK